jgi:hypothetical protein
MGIATQEKTDRNLEFYRRWRIDKESLNELLVEYDIKYPRAYAIKAHVERKYPEAVREMEIAQS